MCCRPSLPWPCSLSLAAARLVRRRRGIAIVALTAYRFSPSCAIPMRASGIDPAVIEVARALGLPIGKVTHKVELPPGGRPYSGRAVTRDRTCVGIATIAAPSAPRPGRADLFAAWLPSITGWCSPEPFPRALWRSARSRLGLLEHRFRFKRNEPASALPHAGDGLRRRIPLGRLRSAAPDHPVIGPELHRAKWLLGEASGAGIEAKSHLR